MTRPVPTSWRRLPGAHLTLIAGWWQDRDPVYADGAAAEGMLRALTAGEPVHEDDWRWRLPGWTLPDALVQDLVDDDLVLELPVLTTWETTPPPHDRCEDPDGGGWREVALLALRDGGWAVLTGTGCACYHWLEHLHAADEGYGTRVETGVTVRSTLAEAVTDGLTVEDRERLHLPLPHEAWTVDDLASISAEPSPGGVGRRRRP